jgi:hypothetical protein
MPISNPQNTRNHTGAIESQSLNEELDFILHGLTDAQKKIVTEAYYGFAQGDKGGFAVRFAILLQAHVMVMKTLPFRLREVFAAQAKEFVDEISAQRAVIKQFTDALAHGIVFWKTRVEVLQGQLQAARASNDEILREMREIQQQIRRDATTIRKAAETQKNPVQFVIPYALLFFVLGLFANAVVQFFWPHTAG